MMRWFSKSKSEAAEDTNDTPTQAEDTNLETPFSPGGAPSEYFRDANVLEVSTPEALDSDLELFENGTNVPVFVRAAPPPNPPFDPRAKLTEDQLEKLNNFHDLMKQEELTDKERDLLCDDMGLLRYLRARNYDLAKAHKMLLDTVVWRREYKPDCFDMSILSREANTGKVYLTGFDLWGRPVIWMSDSRQNSSNFEDGLRLLCAMMEVAIRLMDKRAGVEKLVWVVDFRGYAMSNMPPYKIQSSMLTILANHYPERLGLAIAMDAPKLFSMTYKVISPFIDPVTKQKVAFCAGEKKFKVISKFFNPRTFPAYLGGDWDFDYHHDSYWPKFTEVATSMGLL